MDYWISSGAAEEAGFLLNRDRFSEIGPADPRNNQNEAETNVSTEGDILTLPTMTIDVSGSSTDAKKEHTVNAIEQDWQALQQKLGRRPSIGDYWNREFSGSFPGSVGARAAETLRQKTVEDEMMDHVQRIIDSAAR